MENVLSAHNMVSLFYLSLHFKELDGSIIKCFIYVMDLIARIVNLDTSIKFHLQNG